MTKDVQFFGPYLTDRFIRDHEFQRPYRERLNADLSWGYVGQRYTEPFLEGKPEQKQYLTDVERLMVSHIRFLLEQQDMVRVMDYGAGIAESLKHIQRIFKGDKRVIFFATGLSKVPTDLFLEGISPSNPEIHYIAGDITDILQHQTQVLADGREISLKNSIDIFIANHAISHSQVPGNVLTQLPRLFNDNSLIILSNKSLNSSDPLWDRKNTDCEKNGAIGRARRFDWYQGLDYLQRNGYSLRMRTPYNYNYLVFAGQNVHGIQFP